MCWECSSIMKEKKPDTPSYNKYMLFFFLNKGSPRGTSMHNSLSSICIVIVIWFSSSSNFSYEACPGFLATTSGPLKSGCCAMKQFGWSSASSLQADRRRMHTVHNSSSNKWWFDPWYFPSSSIKGMTEICVFCSPRERANEDERLHYNTKHIQHQKISSNPCAIFYVYTIILET